MPVPPISALESAVLESNAISLGVSVESLMENAGRAVAEEAGHVLPKAPARVAILTGMGNNGGDGSTAAFYLQQWGHLPELWLLGSPEGIRTPAARHAFDRVRRRLPVHLGPPTAEELKPFPLVIDALLGTGQSGPLRGAYAAGAEAIARAQVPVLSVDVPSGEGSPDGVRATWTVALTAPKIGIEPERTGQLIVRDIGIPPKAREETGPGEFHYFRPPGPEGRAARVVILGGGPYSGAPALSGLAALRAGAERATLLCPSAIASEVGAYSPVLVVEKVGGDRFEPSDLPAVLEKLRAMRFHAVAVGMGAGRAPTTVEFFSRLLDALPPEVPVVVDADALEAATRPPKSEFRARPFVLTPNPGELHRLSGDPRELSEPERIGVVEGLAAANQVTFLAKGSPDVVASPGRRVVNRHHHPAATVAGVGDVLDGVVAALLAARVEPYAAARLAAYWVGDAGIRVFGRAGYGVLATDVLEELPVALIDGLRRIGRGQTSSP
jgi:ADP-dependent NAD(P)H-hydrate dehydratase / NAD(P)H-hydrate epimerase